MSKINTIIGPQNFELVRDRVAEILADELANQFVLTGDAENNAKVFLERVVPIDKTETPLVNVKINRGVLKDQVAVNTHETLTFDIDIFHGAKSTDADNGDQVSRLKMQRLMGICRAILEDPQYKTLGFQAPFIQNRHIESMDFADGDPMDTSFKSMGRLTLSVKIPENTDLLIPVVAAGFDTEMTLELTDKGYTYTVNES